MASLITQGLITFARREFRLAWGGIHGAPHWSRVRRNGLILAELTGANRRVVEYFAFIHDLGRLNDNHDPEHGHRAALIAERIAGDLIEVSDHELELLAQACRTHSDGRIDGDITIQTCLDADRLDLGRVGIKPCPTRLCTPIAKTNAVLEEAYKRSLQ
jgi:uncharacterized protein